MTDNEIIKALECCIDGKCQLCPLYDNDTISDNCPTGVLKLCLDLINRQKAEIERLQKAIEVQDIMIEQQDYKLKTAKAEAIKEFWEKLKEKSEFLKDDDDYIGYAECVRVCYGDNLVKEMVGE